MEENNKPRMIAMRNQDFSNQNLTDRDLSNCDLTGCNFNSARGKRVNISGSIITDTTWVGASFVDLKADGVVAKGKVDMTGFKAPGMQAPGLEIEEWILNVSELTDCNLDGAKVGVLRAEAANMSRGSALGWEVGTLDIDHTRLPDVV